MSVLWIHTRDPLLYESREGERAVYCTLELQMAAQRSEDNSGYSSPVQAKYFFPGSSENNPGFYHDCSQAWLPIYLGRCSVHNSRLSNGLD